MKYTVIIHCVYSGPVEERYERCIIRPTTYEDTEHDCVNFVSGAGSETYDFYIVNGLKRQFYQHISIQRQLNLRI